MHTPSNVVAEIRDICYDPVICDGHAAGRDHDMERFQQMLPEVWREVCRHIEIGESSDTLFQLLRSYVPAERLAVYRFEKEHRRLIAAAVVPAAADHTTRAVDLSERQQRKLVQWIRKGVLTRLDRRTAEWFPTALLADDSPAAREYLVAPLSAPHGTLGLIVLTPARGAKLLLKHDAIVRLLQEPLGVALENDRRLHELQVLREAAEADRQSLLTRLGRKELADTVIGSESGLSQVLQRVRQIAPSEVPVLILGETGTGKELIAREIHHSSARRHGPFIRVNCGAIPSELIDSQLFGHEKGSFTGAVETRQGWFERASGGTLFLDEIGEMHPDLQAKFLRVLEGQPFERVGGGKPISVDVRVVTATNRNLEQAVRQGRFRSDLYFRLQVIEIQIPPLREHPEDIVLIAHHFLQRFARKARVRVRGFSREALDMLQRYHWPGNVRELRNVVERAVILADHDLLRPDDITLSHVELTPAPDAAAEPAQERPTEPGPAGDRALPAALDVPQAIARILHEELTLDELDDRYIHAVLERWNWNKSQAARLLGIERTTLDRRLKRYGRQRPSDDE